MAYERNMLTAIVTKICMVFLMVVVASKGEGMITGYTARDEIKSLLQRIGMEKSDVEQYSAIGYNLRLLSYLTKLSLPVYQMCIPCIVVRTCGIDCEQGTIFYPNKTCKCICKKNFASLNDKLCTSASWSRWSSWSACLKSAWGGLQRRERVCKALGKESPGSCDGRGSESTICTAITKDFKIRKNLRDLTDEEFHDLLQAMTKFKKDKSKRGYRNIISWHGYPGRCPWYKSLEGHSSGHCSWHHHPMFLPWHRLITVQLELGLSRYLKNKTMGIPFWDWTEHAKDLPYLIRHATIYDPILKKYINNPFYSTYVKYHNQEKLYSQREASYPGLLMDRYILKGTVRAIMCHDYYNFDKQQSAIPHDQVHDCFCLKKMVFGEDYCYYGMPSVNYAAWDPAFLLHHSAMDRLFVVRRMLEETNGVADWTKSRVIGQYLKAGFDQSRGDITEAFDWPMSPFCNKSMNPESVTRKKGIWMMRNAFYDEQLFGYKYDNFNFGHNYKWEDLQKDYKRNVINRKFWNDDYFVTKLGGLTRANSMNLPTKIGCTIWYSNPKWRIRIQWK